MDFHYSKKLVLATLVGLIGLSAVLFHQHPAPLSAAIDLDTKGQPTIGYPKASVHLVIFEEPKCPDCKNFTNHIFPKIKKDFIDTNKILYTIIPVSFIPNSMPAAVAWLCVYNQDEEYPNDALFFSYVEHTYAKQPSERIDWATEQNLEKFAKETSPAIRLKSLKDCMAREGHRIQIEKNTKYGMHIMKGELGTPTLYINGVQVDDMSYANIRKMIDSALQQKGNRS